MTASASNVIVAVLLSEIVEYVYEHVYSWLMIVYTSQYCSSYLLAFLYLYVPMQFISIELSHCGGNKLADRTELQTHVVTHNISYSLLHH